MIRRRAHGPVGLARQQAAVVRGRPSVRTHCVLERWVEDGERARVVIAMEFRAEGSQWR
jgi:hypothetical protein